MLLVATLFLLVGVGCDPSGDESHSVAFDSQGGTAVASQTVAIGEKVTKPTDPTRENFIFGGWFKKPECKPAWNFDTDTVSGAIILYAKWTPKTVVDVAIKTIAVKKVATQTTFALGDNFNSSGLVIEATLVDDTKKDLNAGEINIDSSAYEKDVVGTYSIIIKLKSDDTISTSYVVKVDKAVSSIAIGEGSTYPTEFVSGDDFNYDGLIIVKTYSDSTTGIADPSEYYVNNSLPSAYSDSQVRTMAFYLYSDKNQTMVPVSYDVTTYASSALEANVISIKTPALKLKFALNDSFSSEGLLIEKTTVKFGERIFEMEESEYDINFLLYDSMGAGTYEITISAITGSSTPCGYSVEVIDVGETTVESIRIKADSEHQTDFFRGEVYNSVGLIVEKVLSGGHAFALLTSEYSIIHTAYQTNALGPYSIEIELTADTLKKTSYQVTVIVPPFVGTYYSINDFGSELQGLCVQKLEFEVKKDGAFYFYSYEGDTLSSTKEDVSLYRDGDSYYFGKTSGGLLRYYNTKTGKFSSGRNEYIAMKSTDIVLPFRSEALSAIFESDPIVFIVPKGGSIEQRFIDGLSSFGKVYKN